MNFKNLLSVAGATLLGLSMNGQVDCQDGYTFPQVSDLIISEYSVVSRADFPETGNSRNTYFEIYNGTGSAVDLSQYRLVYSHNGDTWGSREGDTLFLTGTLPNHELYIITRDFGTGETTTTFPTEKRDVTWVITPNGDDAVGLFKFTSQQDTTYNLIDAYGTVAQPASPWDLCGTSEGSLNYVIRRKQTVTSPNPDWTVSADQATCEWESNDLGEYENVKLPTGCVPPSTGTNVVYTMEFSVYQNSGQLIIESSDNQLIRVTDANGVTITQVEVEAGRNVINLQIENGIYIFSSETSAPVKTMLK